MESEIINNPTEVQEQITNAVNWIDALATTKDKQGKGALGSETYGYCCLGHGCKTLNVGFDGYNGVSATFQEKVGLKSPAGDFTGELRTSVVKDNLFTASLIRSLTNVNDHTSYTFNQISDFIKKHPDGLFKEEVADGINKHYNN